VLVDVRGTGASEGTFIVLDDREARDGYLVVEWAARQQWSSGSVGVTGFSYMGASATHTAEVRLPSLKAIFNGGSPTDVYREFFAAGGVWSYSSVLWNRLANSGSEFEGSFREDAETGMESGELNWDNELWKDRAVDVTRFNAPTLVYTGWEDIFFRSTLRQYRDLRMSPGRKLVVVGPWVHYTFPKTIGPTGTETIDDFEIAWFDRWLKDIRNGIERLGPVILFDQGVDEWSSYSQWPPEGVRYERLYLDGRVSGSATSLNDGSLSESVPMRGSDTGLSDPNAGECSRSLIQFTAGAVPPTSPCNLDQRPEERTAFTYTTDPSRQARSI
jgi:predicted acyl esterase